MKIRGTTLEKKFKRVYQINLAIRDLHFKQFAGQIFYHECPIYSIKVMFFVILQK